MHANKISALLGAVALIEQAAAFNVHRQLHQLEKKQDNVVWETVYQTHYVNANVEVAAPTPAADSGAVVDAPPAAAAAAAAAANAPAAAAVPNPASNAPLPVYTVQLTQANNAQKAAAVANAAAVSPPSAGTGGNGGSSSSAQGSTGSTSGGPGFSGKRGLAYNDPAMANLVGASAKTGAIGWCYNWGQYPGNVDSQYPFIPTLWGRGPNNQGTAFIDTWASTAGQAVANGAKALFSFNEPDNKGQANMDAATAADLHVQYMNPFGDKTLIGSPSVSNSNIPGEGLDWLSQWIQQCKSKGCVWHFCNIHWYDHAWAIDTLFDHIAQAHTICEGKPIWLTEFAPIEADAAQTTDFLDKAIPRLEATDYLHAYSYFMVGTGNLQLLSSPNSLSSIGAKYASL